MNKLIAPISIALGFLGVAFLGFLASANAAGSMSPDDGNLLDLARPIFDSVMSGQYVAAASFALVFAVALVRRYAPAKFAPYVHSDAGGALTTLLLAFGGALGTATIGGAPWSWSMLWVSLTVGIAAMGGYTAVKKLFVEPLLRPLMAKAPPWAQPLFAIAMWMFDKPTAATAKAEAAGAVAVAENPGTGIDAVTGGAKDI